MSEVVRPVEDVEIAESNRVRKRTVAYGLIVGYVFGIGCAIFVDLVY